MKLLLKRFYPTEYAKSAYDIDFEALYESGYRGILFDIDNTLVPHGKPADARAIALFENLREIGFQVVLISNNRRGRVESFAKQVGAAYICGALKPRRKSYYKAMKAIGTDRRTTIFIGDQLLTDIFGANRTGISSILVEPIHRSEEIQIVLKRYLENMIIPRKKRKNRRGKWLKKRDNRDFR